MSTQKRVTRTFFNRVASEWYRRTYDPSGRFESFPGNRVRKDLTLDQIAEAGIRGDILDIGCGPGALVIDLTRRGHTTFGIDISERMIEQARVDFRKARLGDHDGVFRVADLATFSPKRTFAAVTALGVLEYLERDAELFRALARLTAPRSYAFVEARNKLFNLYSANAYTAHAAEKREVARLVDELQTVERFSPLPDTSIPKVQGQVATRVARFLAGLRRRGEERQWFRPARRRRFVPFPQHMKRRQHTPADLARSAERHGFRCEYVVYWHCHPFPPRYERLMPRVYNRLSLLLGPLGYTSLGAWCGSSFVAVLRKA